MSASFDELFDQVHSEQSSKSKNKAPLFSDIIANRNKKETPSEEGGSEFDKLFSQIQSQQPTKGESLRNAPIKGLFRGGQYVNPLNPSNYIPNVQRTKENLRQDILPTQEGPLEDVLEFAGEAVPLALTGEGGIAMKAGQSLAGGAAKAAAKEADLPPWAQELVGGAGMSVPQIGKGVLTKAITPKAKQEAVTKYLTSKGLTPEEITPIIQDPKKLSWLSKGALKYNEKSPFTKGIQEKLGNLYEDIRVQGQNSGYLQGDPLRKFETDFYKTLDNLPRRHKRLIEKEVEELFNNPIDFTSLHDFNIAVNDIIKAAQGGKASIGKLKAATHNAQKDINPSLFQDLRTTDEAYKGLMKFTDKMTKNNWEGLIKLGAAGKLIIGAVTLNPAMMGMGVKVMATVGASRYVLKQLLTNPRLQNIHKKMQQEILKNNFPQALKLAEMFRVEIEKDASVNEVHD